MIQIDDVIVHLDVLKEEFLCDLSSCKGACCIEGDAGAPVSAAEIEKIEALLPTIWEDLSEKAKQEIEKNGVAYIDEEGDLVTTIINGKDCAFTYYDKSGNCFCAIEKAYREGKIDFYKPISCHLYPIRVGDYGVYKALNYHKWDICQCARKLGKEKKVRVYQFLKDPLIRLFGETWYTELEEVAEELKKQNIIK